MQNQVNMFRISESTKERGIRVRYYGEFGKRRLVYKRRE